METKRSQSALRSPQTTLFLSPLAPRPLLLPISMEDSAGTKIAVGCRVAEVDFSFGDGLVESVTVPIVGVGFNVGVRWDDPSKGGPEWSAEGGGRAANHLLVIEGAAAAQSKAAAEQAAAFATFGQPPPAGDEVLGNTLKPLVEYGEEGEELYDAFRSAHTRSPTASETELLAMLSDRMKQREGGASPTPSELLAEYARELDSLDQEAAEAAAEEAAAREDEDEAVVRSGRPRRRGAVVDDDDDEEEAVAAVGAVVAAAAEEADAEAEANAVPTIGTRFVLGGEHGVVVKTTQSGMMLAAYDDGES